jgi:hypothetical protein
MHGAHLPPRPAHACTQELKASGMTREKANRLLSAWSKSGVEDPEQLRKLLVKKSLTPLSGALLQVSQQGHLTLPPSKLLLTFPACLSAFLHLPPLPHTPSTHPFHTPPTPKVVIDSIASFGGFYLSYLVSQSGDFPFKIVLELAGNFAGIYYFINVLLEMSVAAGGSKRSSTKIANGAIFGPAACRWTGRHHTLLV